MLSSQDDSHNSTNEIITVRRNRTCRKRRISWRAREIERRGSLGGRGTHTRGLATRGRKIEQGRVEKHRFLGGCSRTAMTRELTCFVAPIPGRRVSGRTGKKTFTISAHSKPAGRSSSSTILSHCELARELLTSQYLQRRSRVKKVSSPGTVPSVREFLFFLCKRDNESRKKSKTFFFEIYFKQIVPSRPFLGSRARPRCLFLRGGSRPDERGRSARG